MRHGDVRKALVFNKKSEATSRQFIARLGNKTIMILKGASCYERLIVQRCSSACISCVPALCVQGSLLCRWQDRLVLVVDDGGDAVRTGSYCCIDNID